jgi:carbamoyl-phosphate synthase large subunit
VTPTPFPVLFTSVGRRCELVGIFRRSITSLGLEPVIIGADSSRMAPALHFCDEQVMVPRVDDPAYPDAILRSVERRGIRLVVPLIDTELAVHSKLRPRIEASGATALISPAEAVAVTQDKYLTWQFFREIGVPAPDAALPGDGVDALGLPVVVKPRCGSSSENVSVCLTTQERDIALRTTPDPIAQVLATGTELTLDVLTDLRGRPIEVVVRERIRTRGGESVVGVTVDHADVVMHALRIATALHARGPVTMQCFREHDGTVLFTEINARFGGGYPLADAAGADFAGLIVRMCLGENIEPRLGAHRIGLAMSRYDRSVFYDIAEGTAAPSSVTSDESDPS